MLETTVREVMSKDVACVRAHVTIEEVAALMRGQCYSCVIVVDGGTPLGIVTERDMVGVLASVLENTAARARLATEVMTSPPITIGEDATLFEALVLARTRKVRHLPVVNAGGELAGLVTQSDLVRAHQRLIETQRTIIERSVAERTRSLRDANRRLSALALEDALLEIGNRRAMEVDLSYTHENAVRYQGCYSVALFDVDLFKLFNDRYGHVEGDQALKRVAGHIRTASRKSDRLYRYGGEELLLLLPETSIKGAKALARRLVQGVAGLGMPHAGSSFCVLTVSCGVSGGILGSAGWQEVVARADEALYMAKGKGRNCVATIPSRPGAIVLRAPALRPKAA